MHGTQSKPICEALRALGYEAFSLAGGYASWLRKQLVRHATKRDSLNGHSPYELAKLLLDKKVRDSLGLTYVHPDAVKLNPAHLKP